MMSPKDFKRVFLARTKAARETRTRYDQTEMGELLGLGAGKKAQGTYKQYESRSPLPHYLVARFCMICGIAETSLFDHNETLMSTASEEVKIPTSTSKRVKEPAKKRPKRRAA